jgi:hypothetical protein
MTINWLAIARLVVRWAPVIAKAIAQVHREIEAAKQEK